MRIRALLAALGLVGVAALGANAHQTDAAWTDDLQAEVNVSAATWVEPPASAVQCYSVDEDHPDAECTVEGIDWWFWGNSYTVVFGISTDHPQSFEWEVRFNLAEEYTGSYDTLVPGSLPMFPGSPVPAAPLRPAWTPQRFNMSLVCSTSLTADLPEMTLRGTNILTRTVSASDPVAPLLSFTATRFGGSTIDNLDC
jgi:hypothetical protein